jgi:hypothetical protein
MKLTVLAVFAIGAAFGALIAGLEGKAQAEEEGGLEKEIQLVNARLSTQANRIEELEKALAEHRTEFEHHSHPVKYWDPEKQASTTWTGGVFFIAYPKVGKGPGDAAAAAAGGTWGTP